MDQRYKTCDLIIKMKVKLNSMDLLSAEMNEKLHIAAFKCYKKKMNQK